MNIRAAGVLLPISSLPSGFGIGDLGPNAFKFADFLSKSGQTYWQIIPLTPSHPEHYSPYHSSSAFAGNYLLISPELLVKQGLLTDDDIKAPGDFPEEKVDYPHVMRFKTELIHKAYKRFTDSKEPYEYLLFCEEHKKWLDDYCLFRALQSGFDGKKWTEWPKDLRDRAPAAFQEAKEKHKDPINLEKFVQFVFYRQWFELKDYCKALGIQIIGDLPVYVDHNSADVWTHPECFKLDDQKAPYVVAGVPPDYFSATGQLWGHPIYDWDALKADGYTWWLDRMGHNLHLCDIVRIDHFRGLVGYWEVPAGEKTALNGQWRVGPGGDLLRAMFRRFPNLPVIAEDLGVITPDVRECMAQFGLPGMKILMFAFGEDLPNNPYAPHNIIPNSLVYTGTHDNNTVKGWFKNEATQMEKENLSQYINRNLISDEAPWEMIRLSMTSVANTSIIPIQDYLELGEHARINLPSQKEENWIWRLKDNVFTDELAERIYDLTKISGRL